MLSVKQATMLVSDSFSGNSLVYLIILFRAEISLSFTHSCCRVSKSILLLRSRRERKPDKKSARQRTPPSELILFWRHVTSVFQGLSLSRSVGRVGENPGNEVAVSIKQLSPEGYRYTETRSVEVYI